MNRTLALLIVIFFTDLVSAQNLIFYQRPQLSLTEYQQLYAENLVTDTKASQLKGNVKSVTVTLLDRNVDTLTYKEEERYNIKSLYETYKFEFLPNKKLQTYEEKLEREYKYNEYQNYTPSNSKYIKTTTYYFDEENNKLLKIKETNGNSTTEKDFDSLGFLKQEVNYRIGIKEKKQMYQTKNYDWNKQRNTVNYLFNYHYLNKEVEQGKLSFKGESYEKTLYTDTIIGKGKEYFFGSSSTTMFDEKGNIIAQTSYEPDIRSSLPNNYNFSYKYNKDNELTEILKNGTTRSKFYFNQITTFQYDNYDEYGNWQEMTINTSDANGKYTKLKYKREILYY
ncbi:MAG: hypothetical protein CVU03_13405 [Bacteroidetes bacterium HGW-Bacteroidetes-2]|jgi:hypothetical protein|nr:MAG: hypothetical protein CVU03_13405 [Bacteroidetes bacterium HGW-Bacteroidetes-2]